MTFPFKTLLKCLNIHQINFLGHSDLNRNCYRKRQNNRRL